MKKLLAFAAIVEMATGLALMIDPAIVVRLLAGTTLSGGGMPLARFPGVALFSLGWACWPRRAFVEVNAQAYQAMGIYNVLIAIYLAYLALADHLTGVLLWPAIALHAVVAAWMVRAWRVERGSPRLASIARPNP